MMSVDILQQRLYNQRLSRPDFATPAEVVRWFGAVQAQDFLGSLYAIGLRMPSATEQSVEQAVADRTIVRSWPMRGTIHFMLPEDARWMLRLLAPRLNVKAGGIYHNAGLTPDIFARAGAVFTQALQGGKLLQRAQLYEALQVAGVETEGDQRGLHLLGYWAREGLICWGPRQGKQHTFALLDEWIPQARLLEGDEALATIARRYVRSHGPATEHDFAWWTGLTLTEARRALALATQDFAQETIGGQTYWFSGAPTPPPGVSPSAHLLPPYDEFAVAYKDRSAFLNPAQSNEALPGLGPTIIVDGQMVGAWKRTLQKDAVILTISPFAPLSQEQHAAVEVAGRHYARFLGLRAIIAG